MLLLKFYFKKFVETDIHLKLDFGVFLLKIRFVCVFEITVFAIVDNWNADLAATSKR